ncbi:hypothetical protein [Lacipirellula parvula]|uniref:hypothetical protein n=1 Tax=Lacipirellula parvula TaxID=2650471 RepID=UPI0012604497|nr:hypothetical protein [Lacipirellula parvula]
MIERFVAEYDVPFRYDEATGELWRLGCFSLRFDKASLADREVAVGAYYCAMVREDVNLQLAEGLQLLRRSQELAADLKSEAGRLSAFGCYALARWFDAKGRLLYRCGNHALAQVAFREANGLVEQGIRRGLAGVSRCLADIQSNQIRNEFELTRQSGTEASKAEACRKRLKQSIESAEVCLSCGPSEYAAIEITRGLISCLHNWLSCVHVDSRPHSK